jgi:hypothetical protein
VSFHVVFPPKIFLNSRSHAATANVHDLFYCRRELLEGQDLHMEARETEELLDWIASEAGLEEVLSISN